MAEQSKPLNKGYAVLITIAAFVAAGSINGYYVNDHLGALGGLIVDVIGLMIIIEAWRKTMKPKAKTSDKSDKIEV